MPSSYSLQKIAQRPQVLDQLPGLGAYPMPHVAQLPSYDRVEGSEECVLNGAVLKIDLGSNS